MQPIAKSDEPQVGELLFSDNFTSTKVGSWTISYSQEANLFYKDGKYQFELFKPSDSRWAYGKNFSDFVMEVEATQEGGPDDNAYGIVFRKLTAAGNYYSLLISGDGYYKFKKTQNGKVVIDPEWKPSGAIKTGNATNVIKAVCSGDKLAFYVNGAKLEEIVDSSFPAGAIGFWAQSINAGGVHISFDNLKVWAIKKS
jgi:hypothetical protein